MIVFIFLVFKIFLSFFFFWSSVSLVYVFWLLMNSITYPKIKIKKKKQKVTLELMKNKRTIDFMK
jgi:hypothetical protein